MSKFHGSIGFITETTETSPGIWTESIEEKSYVGELLKTRASSNQSGAINPDVSITDTVSIIADGYALDNLAAIRYVLWRGARWSIASIEVSYPRLLLTLGGLYGKNPTE